MDVLRLAAAQIAADLTAWQADPLHFAADLRPFVSAHHLAPLVRRAVEVAVAPAPGLGRPAGYAWQHGLRVARQALRLAAAEDLSARIDAPALFVTALWHDLAHTQAGDGHQLAGAALAARELPAWLPPEQVNRIARWIAASDEPQQAWLPEQQLLWDANALDLHGALFIARSLSYLAAQGLPPELAPGAYEALAPAHAAWREQAFFETTRRDLAQRAAAEGAYLEALRRELG
ncbi:MAG: hypothetical protein IT204_11690 [Fimbriimonadaceae bacterium]|nr:hypothetical protein [Fimbriimonadaceae bacterium]